MEDLVKDNKLDQVESTQERGEHNGGADSEKIVKTVSVTITEEEAVESEKVGWREEHGIK